MFHGEEAEADTVPPTFTLPLIAELPETDSDPPESCPLVDKGAVVLRLAADSVPPTFTLPLIAEFPETDSDPPESCPLVDRGAVVLRLAADSVPPTDTLPLIAEFPDTASDPPESCALVATGDDVLMLIVESGAGAITVPEGVVVTDMKPVAAGLWARTGEIAAADAKTSAQMTDRRTRRSMVSFIAGARDLLRRW